MFRALRQSSLGNMFKKTDHALVTSAPDTDSSNQRQNSGDGVIASPNTEDKNTKPASSSVGFLNSFLRRSEKKRYDAKPESKKGEKGCETQVAPLEFQGYVHQTKFEPRNNNKSGVFRRKQPVKKGFA